MCAGILSQQGYISLFGGDLVRTGTLVKNGLAAGNGEWVMGNGECERLAR